MKKIILTSFLSLILSGCYVVQPAPAPVAVAPASPPPVAYTAPAYYYYTPPAYYPPPAYLGVNIGVGGRGYWHHH